MLDVKKLVGITDKARGAYLGKVKEWLEHRQKGIAETMVKRAEEGFGFSNVSIPVNQVLGFTPNKDTINNAISVCREAVAEFVGKEAKVSGSANYDNVIITVVWREL